MLATLPAETTGKPAAGTAPRWAILAMALGGLLLSLGFPTELLPGQPGDHPSPLIAWLALVPFCWGLAVLPPRAARWGAFCYGVAFYAGTLTWLRLFGEGVLAVLPWAALAAYLALTPLLAVLLVGWMQLPRWLTPLGLAAAWTGLEWLRGQGMFGFAWSELGMSQVDGALAQLSPVGGVPLITFCMLWVVGAAVQRVVERESPRWALALPVLVTGALLVIGHNQSAGAAARWQRQPGGQMVSLIQPSTQKGLTPASLVVPSTPEERAQRVDTLTALTRQAAAAQDPATPAGAPHLLVWSESAVGESPFAPWIGALSRETGTYLVAGAPRLVSKPEAPRAQDRVQMRNAAALLGPQGSVLDIYDKIHLVPFGEFVPARAAVERLYTVRGNDVIPGERRAPLDVAGHPIGVAICFESTFTEIAREYAGQQARLLVIITNDAWFHRTSAVRQHFNQSRFRAIETGLPVARTAGTGISGFIAPDGRVLEEIPVYATDTRTRYLPDGVGGTLYTAGGWCSGPLALLGAVMLAVAGLVAARRRRSSENVTPS